MGKHYQKQRQNEVRPSTRFYPYGHFQGALPAVAALAGPVRIDELDVGGKKTQRGAAETTLAAVFLFPSPLVPALRTTGTTVSTLGHFK